MVKHQRDRNGFTFVELLITSTLIAFLGLAIYSAFRNGILIWQRAQQKGVNQEEIIIFTERLAKELRNSFPFSGIGFKGEKETISFPHLLAEIYSAPETGEKFLVQKPGRITYFWDNTKETLNRSQENYSEVFQHNPDPPYREMVKGVKEIIMTYYQFDKEEESFEWLEKWDETEQVPCAVRIEIRFNEGDYEQTIARTIFIPASF